VPGGKLLRVRLTLDRAADVPTLRSVRITGDFFMHPEEAIETLEAQLTGVAFTADAVRRRVQAFFAGDVVVVGADAEDVVTAMMKAR
jgi:lipoate-protein ligase A